MTSPDRGEMLNVILSDLYDDTLLNHVYSKLSQEGITEEQAHAAMDELVLGLMPRRMNSSTQEWNNFVSLCLHHPLKDLVHQDPFTNRAFQKPRGFAGDAVLLDYVYGREEHWLVPDGTTALGQMIFNYTTNAPAPEGVRARRGFIGHLLDQVAEEKSQPHILSIAAGHLREALLSAAVKRKKIGRYVALDSDTESLEEVDRCYGRFGVEVVPATIRQLLTQKVDLSLFDLVYSTGLFDYVQQATGQRLVGAMFQMLRPGGQLVVANFLPGIRDIGYMESYMAWELIYRTRLEMLDLAMTIPQPDIRDIRIFTEENQNIIFLQVTRR
jgi:hypothetical protein